MGRRMRWISLLLKFAQAIYCNWCIINHFEVTLSVDPGEDVKSMDAHLCSHSHTYIKKKILMHILFFERNHLHPLRWIMNRIRLDKWSGKTKIETYAQEGFLMPKHCSGSWGCWKHPLTSQLWWQAQEWPARSVASIQGFGMLYQH